MKTWDDLKERIRVAFRDRETFAVGAVRAAKTGFSIGNQKAYAAVGMWLLSRPAFEHLKNDESGLATFFGDQIPVSFSSSSVTPPLVPEDANPELMEGVPPPREERSHRTPPRRRFHR